MQMMGYTNEEGAKQFVTQHCKAFAAGEKDKTQREDMTREFLATDKKTARMKRPAAAADKRPAAAEPEGADADPNEKKDDADSE
eukprot:7427708-Pyramimonas_sp.AAC.1